MLHKKSTLIVNRYDLSIKRTNDAHIFRVSTFLTTLLVAVITVIFTLRGYSQNNPAMQAAREFYNTVKNPEISFEEFYKTHGSYYVKKVSVSKRVDVGSLDACLKVRPYCTNGDFESGLTETEWSGAYGTWTGSLSVNPQSLTNGFSSGVLGSASARQTIVNKSDGVDPVVGINLVPTNGGNRALRLGNSASGYGAEILAKTVEVDASETILNFWYAVVFQDPNHPYDDQPAFSVRVYDCASGLELTNVCNLGNNSNIIVSDASNPFFKSANSGSIAYRDWTKAQINLSAHIGKRVTIVFTNKDCGQGAHYGYTYLDNLFSSNCVIPDPTPVGSSPGTAQIETSKSDDCGSGRICVKYVLPKTEVASVTNGDARFELEIYQNNSKLTTLTSPTLTNHGSDSTYCFNINPGSLALNSSLGGFDYVVTAKFTLPGYTQPDLFVGNPPTGQKAGVNNDYLVACTPVNGNVYYSKPTGNLHNVATWGVNPDGTGAQPIDFGAGKTFNLANRPGVYTMTGNWTVMGTLNIPAGSRLQIGSYTLTLYTVTGTGTLAGSVNSSLAIRGTGNFGNINFSSDGGSLKALTLNRTGAGAAATIGTALSIYDVLTVTSGILNTGGRLTLKSTATNTARVAPVGGNINGNVTVERYFPARRAWRIVGSPVTGNQSVNQAWQEGATTASANPNPAPGYGTYITVGSVANGFDQNILGLSTSSLKTYNSASNTWLPVTNTHNAKVGTIPYFVFVRGDRSITMRDNKVPANNTTLRATGTLNIGDKTYNVAASGFTAIANPYASPINFATITRNNVDNSFYVWDPKMGGTNGVGAYVNISFNGTGYDVTPASVSPESQYIQSGQGFLVHAMNGRPGSITIKESDKSATPAQNVFRKAEAEEGDTPLFAPAKNAQGLRITLQSVATDNSVLDEVFASYSSNFSNEIDEMDAVKVPNVMENLSIIRKNRELMVERRDVISTADTLHLRLWNTTASSYAFEFNPIDLVGAESVLLQDHYLNTSTAIDLTQPSQVYFQVGNDEQSTRADRFKVIIINKKPLFQGLRQAAVKAYPNPVQGGAVNLKFENYQPGTYQLQLMNNAGQVISNKKVVVSAGNFDYKLFVGSNLPAGVYQLQITGNNCKSVIKIMNR